MIYVGNEECIAKECEVIGEDIKIDDNSYKIIELKNQEFEAYSFKNVYIENLN